MGMERGLRGLMICCIVTPFQSSLVLIPNIIHIFLGLSSAGRFIEKRGYVMQPLSSVLYHRGRANTKEKPDMRVICIISYIPVCVKFFLLEVVEKVI